MLLSVIIPVYNCEKYIEQCVYSILDQPLSKNIQIIIVDDGSPDNSGRICDGIANTHDNVTVIHKENGGVSSARNVGLEKASGEYVAFVDGDDWWEKDFFDEDILSALSAGYDIYGFSFNHVINGKYYKTFSIQPELKVFEKYCKGKCDYNYFVSYFYKSEIIKNNKLTFPIGVDYGEDMNFLEKYFYFVCSYQKINKVLYDYRKNTSSFTHTKKIIDVLSSIFNVNSGLRDWYNSLGEDYNLDSVCGMIFSEVLDDLCGQNTYSYCKNYINDDPRFNCINNYKNIGIPPYYYPKVKHFMEHTFLFWLVKKIQYKTKMVIMRLIEKHKFLSSFLDYIVYKKIRGYKSLPTP